jgi:hypothetical protein
MGWTFTAVTIAWVFFRADNINDALTYISLWTDNLLPLTMKSKLLLVAIFCVIDFLASRQHKIPVKLENALWIVIVSLLLVWRTQSSPFIYFNF